MRVGRLTEGDSRVNADSKTRGRGRRTRSSSTRREQRGVGQSGCRGQSRIIVENEVLPRLELGQFVQRGGPDVPLGRQGGAVIVGVTLLVSAGRMRRGRGRRAWAFLRTQWLGCNCAGWRREEVGGGGRRCIKRLRSIEQVERQIVDGRHIAATALVWECKSCLSTTRACVASIACASMQRAWWYQEAEISRTRAQGQTTHPLRGSRATRLSHGQVHSAGQTLNTGSQHCSFRLFSAPLAPSDTQRLGQKCPTPTPLSLIGCCLASSEFRWSESDRSCLPAALPRVVRRLPKPAQGSSAR